MKNNIYLTDVVSADAMELAKRFLSFCDSNFIAQVKFLSLDPKKDFRNADLRGVDFSNSDICGYDFTGADLRGATGVNVTWDATTILDGAETSDSLFAYSLAREKFLSQNPELAEYVERLKRNHWTRTILEVADLLDKRHVSSDSLWIAKAVFEETSDVVVRSNILFFMAPIARDADEHKAFLFNIFAKYSEHVGTIKAAIRTLSSLYASDAGAISILSQYLEHRDWGIRTAALDGILSSPHFMRVRTRLLDYVLACGDPALRRNYVRRVARYMGREYLAACFDPDANNLFDFDETITRRKLERSAELALRREKVVSIASQDLRRNVNMEGSLKISESEIQDRADRYQGALVQMREQYGVPFVIKDR